MLAIQTGIISTSRRVFYQILLEFKLFLSIPLSNNLMLPYLLHSCMIGCSCGQLPPLISMSLDSNMCVINLSIHMISG